MCHCDVTATIFFRIVSFILAIDDVLDGTGVYVRNTVRCKGDLQFIITGATCCSQKKFKLTQEDVDLNDMSIICLI